MCWPVAARGGARGVTLERVTLRCPLRCLHSCVFLLGALGFDAPCGVVDGDAAELVGFGTSERGSRAGIVGVAVRVDRAHPELVATGFIGSKLADQQRQALLPVPPLRRLVSGVRGFDSAVGLGHAPVALGSAGCCLRRPCR